MWKQPFCDYREAVGLSPILAELSANATGAVSFYVLERPVRRYLNRVWGLRPELHTGTVPTRT